MIRLTRLTGMDAAAVVAAVAVAGLAWFTCPSGGSALDQAEPAVRLMFVADSTQTNSSADSASDGNASRAQRVPGWPGYLGFAANDQEQPEGKSKIVFRTADVRTPVEAADAAPAQTVETPKADIPALPALPPATIGTLAFSGSSNVSGTLRVPDTLKPEQHAASAAPAVVHAPSASVSTLEILGESTLPPAANHRNEAAPDRIQLNTTPTVQTPVAQAPVEAAKPQASVVAAPAPQVPPTPTPAPTAPDPVVQTPVAPTAPVVVTEVAKPQAPIVASPAPQAPPTPAPTAPDPVAQTPVAQEAAVQAPTPLDVVAEIAKSQAPIVASPAPQAPPTPAPTAPDPVAQTPVAQEAAVQAPTAPAAVAEVAQPQAPVLAAPAPVPVAQPQVMQSPAAQMPLGRSQGLEQMARQADSQIRHGFELANHGGYFAARAEITAALRLVADGLDGEEHTSAHSEALAAGLLAMKEAQDFVPTGSKLEADLDVRGIIGSHNTPVLKHAEAWELRPMLALKRYHTFAQEQLSQAAGREVAGSMALYALGKVYAAMAAEGSDIPVAEPKAIVCFHASLIVCSQNYMAANDLGALLARDGDYVEARRMLEHSVMICRCSSNLANLSRVYQQLGEQQLAALAAEKARYAGLVEAARMKQSQGTSNGQVRWVDPDTLAQSANDLALPAPQTRSPATADPGRSLMGMQNNSDSQNVQR